MPWLLSEDEAMKAYLSGMKVADQSSPPGGRNVAVWFRDPEPDVRERTYPYISIDLVDIQEAPERAMEGKLKLSSLKYAPPDPVPVQIENHTLVAERPLPVWLFYQVAANSRNAYHDRALKAAMFRKFPGRWGALHVPDDNTARTMQQVSATSSADIDNYGKRLFRNIYTVRVASEMWPIQILQVQNMQTINFTIADVLNPQLVLSFLNCDSE